MKTLLIAAALMLGCTLTASATVPVSALGDAYEGAERFCLSGSPADAEHPCPDDEDRQALCYGPVHQIPDDDPGLALYAGNGESLDDRKVRLAIERANSCDFHERPIETLSADEYEAMTGGEFICDDEPRRRPERCGLPPDD